MVEYMDTLVGRIIKKLDEFGLRENTLLLFYSDNGSPREITSRLGDREIQGGKGFTTDAGTRVPLIANWKDTTPASVVCDDLIDYSAFLPTLMELAETSLPENETFNGRSFLPQLRGERGNPRE
jgi:arylsulfatase A